MKISTKGRYALEFMLDLARQPQGEFVALKVIASHQSISVKYLEQIVPLLLKAGLVEASRGTNGGYRLSAAPKDYTVGMILRATEGSLAPVSCAQTCPSLGACKTQSMWQGLHQVIGEYLDRFTLEDLMEE